MNCLIGVAVRLGHLGVQIQLQLADHVAWNIGLSQCGDEVQRLGSVVRHERIHDDLVVRNAESVCNTLWQVREDLARRVIGADNKWKVQSVVESDLNQSCVGR